MTSSDDKSAGMIGILNFDQQIISNVQDGLIVTSRDMSYMAWNKAMERISGLSADAVLGKRPLDLFPFLKEIGFESLFERALSGETITTQPFPFEIPATGNKGWSSQTMAPFRTADGEIVGVITTVRDVTAQRWAELRVRQHVRVLELLTSRAPLTEILGFISRSVENNDPEAVSSILLFDDNGRWLAHASTPNLPADFVKSIEGVDRGGVWFDGARNGVRMIVQDVSTDPLAAEWRESFQKAGLRACWVQPISAANRNLLGVLVICWRETRMPSVDDEQNLEAAAGYAGLAIEWTRAEEQRQRLEFQVQNSQKLESLGVLAGGIAHDFNNLLTAILSYAEMAQLQIPQESVVQPMIQEIEQAAERAAELAGQMLTYSGRGKFLIGPVQVDTVVAEMAKLLSTVISKKAELQFDLQPLIIEGDATQIRQIVMNLITNASDALEGKSGTIILRTFVRPMETSQLRSSILLDELPPGLYGAIEVEDSGCGMSDATLARIFDPFFTTKPSGRGLGLAAVVGIVRGHCGTIQVKSNPGNGTLFRIIFPAAEEVRAADPPRPKTTTHLDVTGTILVVDDEISVNRVTCDVLSRAGFQILTAHDGRDGIALYEQCSQEIRAIVLDLSMPHLNGLEVAESVRRLNLAVPILFTSGYNEQDSAERLTEIGHASFLQKPFRPSDLMESIRQMLSE